MKTTKAIYTCLSVMVSILGKKTQFYLTISTREIMTDTTLFFDRREIDNKRAFSIIRKYGLTADNSEGINELKTAYFFDRHDLRIRK